MAIDVNDGGTMLEDRTVELLERWHEGDSAALHELVERDSTWILAQVRQGLGDQLRNKVESVDVVQDAMVEILRYAPRFVVRDRARFRALLSRIVQNVICDQHQFFHAKRRAMSREAVAGAISLDGLYDGTERPSQDAVRLEEAERLRLALELLDPEDRAVIVLRQFDGLPFEQVGERLGLPANTARMRFQRALPRLTTLVGQLLDGTWS